MSESKTADSSHPLTPRTKNNEDSTDLPDRIITAPERRRIVPYSEMQIWRLEREGKFPRRIRLGANRVGWSLNEIMDWINVCKGAR
jgi:prophage regulatory protein